MTSAPAPAVAASTDVAVVIPTFQRAEQVERAIASVIDQTRAPREVIVVDDGSTDGTAERIQSKFKGVTVLRQENLGVSAARNRGIRESTAEWVAFLDSDDEWLPRKLERQVDDLLDSGHLVGQCGEIWIRRGRRVNPRQRHAKHGGWIYRQCLPLCVISPSASVVHRTVLERVGPFDETLPVCEDYDLWLRIAARYPVRFFDEALVTRYGGHADQLSRSRWGLDRYRVLALERAWRHLDLRREDRIATLETLLEKLDIVLSGARKRQHDELVDDLQRRREHFGHLLGLERANG